MLSKYKFLPGCRLVSMLFSFELGKQTPVFSGKKDDSGRPRDGWVDKKVIGERLRITSRRQP